MTVPRFVALRVVIALLCIWHMTAVAAFAWPDGVSARFDALRERSMPAVRPYMLALSQWQQWNLFSPDPLRRVTTYRVDEFVGGRWNVLERYAPGSLPWYRHAAWFKYFSSLLDDEAEHLQGVQRRFLELRCDMLGLSDRTTLQLVLERRVLPHHSRPESAAWWLDANLPTEELSIASFSCER